jgi:hypothetical protein
VLLTMWQASGPRTFFAAFQIMPPQPYLELSCTDMRTPFSFCCEACTPLEWLLARPQQEIPFSRVLTTALLALQGSRVWHNVTVI